MCVYNETVKISERIALKLSNIVCLNYNVFANNTTIGLFVGFNRINFALLDFLAKLVKTNESNEIILKVRKPKKFEEDLKQIRALYNFGEEGLSPPPNLRLGNNIINNKVLVTGDMCATLVDGKLRR